MALNTLRTWLTRHLASKPQTTRRRPASRRFQLEALEDRTVPAVTAATLDIASDSGTPADNVTNIATPTINGSADPGADIQIEDNGGNPLGTTTADAVTGDWTIALAAALPEGTNNLVARDVTNGGDFPFLVTIDTGPPFPAPEAPDLDAASDNGASNSDNVTSLNQLTFRGSTEGDARITLLNNGQVVGSGVADAFTGEWAVDVTLAKGVHNITVIAQDVAGNDSVESPALKVTVADPVVRLTPSLFTKKVGRKKFLFARVSYSDGRANYEIRSPLQKTGYKGIKVVVLDTNGDGAADSIEISGKKGRKIKKVVIAAV